MAAPRSIPVANTMSRIATDGYAEVTTMRVLLPSAMSVVVTSEPASADGSKNSVLINNPGHTMSLYVP